MSSAIFAAAIEWNADTAKAIASFEKLNTKLGRFNAAIARARRNQRALLDLTRRLGDAGTWAFTRMTLPVSLFGAALVGTHGKMESWRIAFQTVLRDNIKGLKLFDEAVKFSVSTPFTTQASIERTQQLLGAGVPDPVKWLSKIGDIAAGVGRATDEGLRHIVHGFAKGFEKFRIDMEALEPTITAGAGVIAKMTEMGGFRSKEHFYKAMERSQVNVTLLMDAIDAMTSQGGRFYRSMERQAEGIRVSWAEVRSGWFVFADSMGEFIVRLFGVHAILKKVTSTLLDYTERLREWYKTTSEFTRSLMRAAGWIMLFAGPALYAAKILVGFAAHVAIAVGAWKLWRWSAKGGTASLTGFTSQTTAATGALAGLNAAAAGLGSTLAANSAATSAFTAGSAARKKPFIPAAKTTPTAADSAKSIQRLLPLPLPYIFPDKIIPPRILEEDEYKKRKKTAKGRLQLKAMQQQFALNIPTRLRGLERDRGGLFSELPPRPPRRPIPTISPVIPIPAALRQERFMRRFFNAATSPVVPIPDRLRRQRNLSSAFGMGTLGAMPLTQAVSKTFGALTGGAKSAGGSLLKIAPRFGKIGLALTAVTGALWGFKETIGRIIKPGEHGGLPQPLKFAWDVIKAPFKLLANMAERRVRQVREGIKWLTTPPDWMKEHYEPDFGKRWLKLTGQWNEDLFPAQKPLTQFAKNEAAAPTGIYNGLRQEQQRMITTINALKNATDRGLITLPDAIASLNLRSNPFAYDYLPPELRQAAQQVARTKVVKPYIDPEKPMEERLQYEIKDESPHLRALLMAREIAAERGERSHADPNTPYIPPIEVRSDIDPLTFGKIAGAEIARQVANAIHSRAQATTNAQTPTSPPLGQDTPE